MSHRRHHQINRTLYALVWADRSYCYIGQTTNLARRSAEHARVWQDLGAFEVYELDHQVGTRQEIEEWEYAWRIRAQWSGFHVVGGSDVSGAYLVKPMKRSTPGRLAKAASCKWPLRRFPWMMTLLGALALLVLASQLI